MSITENLLKRKLQQGGVARSPLPEPDFIGETFARQLEEGFRPLVKTMVSAMVLECKIIKLADAMQDISVPTMLGLAEVEDTKAQGLLAVDTDLAYHLIDLMLGGDHASAPVPITRSFTSIDMALCRLPLEALANAFMGAVASCFGRPVTRSLDIVGQRQDITQVRIAPDYVDVLVYNIALDIGEAARAGNLQLVLPLATLDAIRAAVQDEVPDEHASQAQDLWKIQMRRAARNFPGRHQRRSSPQETDDCRAGGAQTRRRPRNSRQRARQCRSHGFPARRKDRADCRRKARYLPGKQGGKA